MSESYSDNNHADSLKKLMRRFKKLPNGTHREEMMLIAPVILLLSQVEGKGEFYAPSTEAISLFERRLYQYGWFKQDYPPPEEPTPEDCHLYMELPHGKLRYDLPQQNGMPAKRARQRGAQVYLSLDFRLGEPYLRLVDAGHSDVEAPDVDSHHSFASVAENLLEQADEDYLRDTKHANYRLLLRAARYLIWEMTNSKNATREEAATAPMKPITFESLGLCEPPPETVTFLDKLVERWYARPENREYYY